MPAQPTTRKRTTKAAATSDPHAIIAAARLSEKTVDLCLRPDLQVEFENATKALSELTKRPDMTAGMKKNPDIVAAEKRVDEALAAMRAAVVTFRFRAFSKAEYKAAKVAHPAKPGNDLHTQAGYDLDAVESFQVRALCLDPELSPEEWDSLENELLTPFQWEQLVAACDGITHTEPTSVPFLSAAL